MADNAADYGRQSVLATIIKLSAPGDEVSSVYVGEIVTHGRVR